MRDAEKDLQAIEDVVGLEDYIRGIEYEYLATEVLPYWINKAKELEEKCSRLYFEGLKSEKEWLEDLEMWESEELKKVFAKIIKEKIDNE